MANLTLLAFLVMTVLSCNGRRKWGNANKRPGYDYRWFKMPENCKHQRYCDTYESYPEGIVDDILANYTQSLKSIAARTQGYESRVSDSTRDPECFTKEIKYQPLFYILDKRNHTRVVIQSKKHNFTQRYDIRSCRKEGRVNKTLNYHAITLNAVKMTCRNVMTQLDFQVLTERKDAMELISIEMPVYCKARYD